MFWYKNLVIFSKRICFSKELFIKMHTTLSNVEHLFLRELKCVKYSFPCVNAHRRKAWSIPFKKVKWSSDNSKKVSWKPIGFSKNRCFRIQNLQRVFFKQNLCNFKVLKQTVFSFLMFFFQLMFIWYHTPVNFCKSTELPNCFKVRLVKAWEYEMAVVSFELCIQVLQTVLLIFEWV